MNAKEELLRYVVNDGKKIKCATIAHGLWGFLKIAKEIVLKVGYSQEDYEKFLESLDFEYNSGYGGQELFGTIWMENNCWYTRGEYDGSEWWEFHSYPSISQECIPAEGSEHFVMKEHVPDDYSQDDFLDSF